MRDNINIDPSLKLFESYKNFTNGLNTESSNETLRDGETTILNNVELKSRGSMRKREPYKRVYCSTTTTNTPAFISASPLTKIGQGMFKFTRTEQLGSSVVTSVVAIIAFNGKIYSATLGNDEYSYPVSFPAGVTDISADNGGWSFQTTAPIEAVQYRDKMYITTGERIGVLEYDSTKASKFSLTDLVASTINEFQASYTGYNLYNSSNDITNVFYNKISSVSNTFNVSLVSKGIIDTSVNTVPDYQFYLDQSTVAAPASYLTVTGYTKLILSVTVSKLATGALPNFRVRFEQSTDGITWNTPVLDDSANPTATAQGTYVFTIGAVNGITQPYFRANIIAPVSGAMSGYVNVHVQPQFILRAPVVGDTVRFWAYWEADVAAHAPVYDYQFEIKKFDDESFPATPSQAYSTVRFFDYTLDGYGQFDVRVTMKKASHTSNPSTLTPFTVYPTAQSNEIGVTSLASEIKKCTRCLVYWDRLILYQGGTYAFSQATPNRVYVSELGDFGYFPQSGWFDVITDAMRPVTSIIRHRGQLVLFTPSQIYTLTGKYPAEFNLSLINDTIGCEQGYTTAVVDNDILFAGRDGVYALRPSAYILNNFNVAILSDSVQNTYFATLNEQDSYGVNLIGYYFDDYYYITNRYDPLVSGTSVPFLKYCVPTKAWGIDYVDPRNTNTMDSTKCGVAGIFVSGKRLFTLFTATGSPAGSGTLYSVATIATMYVNISEDVSLPAYLQADRLSFTDLYDKSYTMKVRTKFYDFSASFNKKKLKRIYILVKTNEGVTAANVEDIRLAVTVEADSQAVLDPNVGTVVTVGTVSTWVVTPTFNFNFEIGTQLGDWVLATDALGAYPIACEYLNIRGKCRRIRLTVEHSDPVPAEIVATGFQFRLKKP